MFASTVLNVHSKRLHCLFDSYTGKANSQPSQTESNQIRSIRRTGLLIPHWASDQAKGSL